MGQQQLLLLVLGIVIVGLAVVVGIQAFGENQRKSSADAMINDGVRIASDTQAWSLKPTAFGGPGELGLAELSFPRLGYTLGGNGCEADEYGTLNGCFVLAVSTTDGAVSVTITGTADNGNVVTVTVSGTNPEDITATLTTS